MVHDERMNEEGEGEGRNRKKKKDLTRPLCFVPLKKSVLSLFVVYCVLLFVVAGGESRNEKSKIKSIVFIN